MRNPKDNIMSLYHFSDAYDGLKTPNSFEDFLEDYMAGNGRLLYSFNNDNQAKSSDEKFK